MKVIFLDIDGVLNTPSSESRCGEYIGIDDEKVEKLKKIVEKTKAEIVLISTWKKYWRKEEKLKPLQYYSANYLDEKLANQGLKALEIALLWKAETCSWTVCVILLIVWRE